MKKLGRQPGGEARRCQQGAMNEEGEDVSKVLSFREKRY